MRSTTEKLRLLANAQSAVRALTPVVGGSCTWGQIDHLTQFAPGVCFVSTPSHGGFLVTADNVAKWAPVYRDFKPFAGAGAYEEDCDAVIVILAMPELFKSEDVANAARAVRAYGIYYGEKILAAVHS